MRQQPPITRRHAIEIGSLGLLGISLPRFLQLQALQAKTRSEPAANRPIQSCIFIFYYGIQIDRDLGAWSANQ